MRVAILCTGGYVESPGRAQQVCVYEVDAGTHKLVETYPNPALFIQRPANMSPNVPLRRGIRAVKAILDKGADALVLREVGEYEFRLAKGKAKLYAFEGSAEQAISLIAHGGLQEVTAPTETEGPRGRGMGGGRGRGMGMGGGRGWGTGGPCWGEEGA
ncbi:MAG: diguanylate cyclase [TACK group archaeon]|nr:diguanylate cyclase [TACK group archaeon]